jgi:ubiquinol-cytochrome c reductase iron-sulfur subunit
VIGPRNPLLRALVALGALLLGRGRRRRQQRGRRAEPPPARELHVGADRRAEDAVLVLLLAATVAAVAFVVVYVLEPDTQLLGLALGLALAFLAAACAAGARRLVPQEQAAEEYPEFGDEEVQADVDAIVREGGAGISRRRLIAGAAGTAGVAVGTAALVPAASLGPSVGDRIRATPWRRGRRVVDEAGLPVRAVDIAEGTFLTAFAAGADRKQLSASLIVVRVAPAELDLPPERRAGAPDGILAFSKICTHAGCAVSMYREPLYAPTAPDPALICPCHYSTFDPRRGGKVTFGPAGRPLPQLPLRVNASGELEADGDFFGQVGPSYRSIRRGARPS